MGGKKMQSGIPSFCRPSFCRLLAVGKSLPVPHSTPAEFGCSRLTRLVKNGGWRWEPLFSDFLPPDLLPGRESYSHALASAATEGSTPHAAPLSRTWAIPLKVSPLKVSPLKVSPLKVSPLKVSPLKVSPLKASSAPRSGERSYEPSQSGRGASQAAWKESVRSSSFQECRACRGRCSLACKDAVQPVSMNSR